MIRRFNFTRRHRIAHSDIEIQIDPGQRKVVDVQIAPPMLGAYDGASPLYLEATKPGAIAFVRFELGPCGTFAGAGGLDYSELGCSHPTFSLKVVDVSENHGRLKGLAEHIRATAVNADDQESDSLLPVNIEDDMGMLPWALVLLR